MQEQEHIATLSDTDLSLEEHFISLALPHLEKMLADNRRQLAAVQAEKSRRAGMAVAA